jgi:hypothetical protein
MEEKKYLNEEEYQKNNAKVKKVGKIVLIIGISMFVIGITLLLIGFLGFGSSALNNDIDSATYQALGGMGLFVVGGLLNTFGFFAAGIGGMLLFISHRREITAYSTQQVMPVAKEGVEEMAPVAAKAAETMAPSAGKVAEEITKGVKKGLKEEK